MRNLSNSNHNIIRLPLIALISILNVNSIIAQQADAEVPRDISSAYTSLNLEKCHLITQAELGLPELTEEEIGTMGGRWLCQGYNKSIVYVAEGDLRMFVSYGEDAINERASHQTLTPFNFIGDTLEWRVEKINGEWIPFATILRWHTESGDMAQDKGEVLIVTKLESGNTCHVAYVDTKLHVLSDRGKNHNEIARIFADEFALDFNCEIDEPHYYPS